MNRDRRSIFKVCLTIGAAMSAGAHASISDFRVTAGQPHAASLKDTAGLQMVLGCVRVAGVERLVAFTEHGAFDLSAAGKEASITVPTCWDELVKSDQFQRTRVLVSFIREQGVSSRHAVELARAERVALPENAERLLIPGVKSVNLNRVSQVVAFTFV